MGLVFQTCATGPPILFMNAASNPLIQEVRRHAKHHATPSRRLCSSCSSWRSPCRLASVKFRPEAFTAPRRSTFFPKVRSMTLGLWTVGAETSFTQEAADYTESMVADDRLTMLHARPIHLDTMTVWSATSPPIQTSQRAFRTVRARGQRP